MTNWYVGMKVVCLGMTERRPEDTLPKKGITYTIREITSYNDCGGLRLDEIVNSPRPHKEGITEVAFCISRFRPLVKTNISIFEAMLHPIPTKQQEPVEI